MSENHAENSPTPSGQDDAARSAGAPGDPAPAAGQGVSDPNPFSRQGSAAVGAPTTPDVPAADPGPPDRTPGPTPPQSWPGYPPSAADTTYNPVGAANQPYGPPEQPYGAPDQPYGSPEQPYGAPTQPYPQASPFDAQPQAYGVNPYAPPQNPYQPSYGAYSPYGVAAAPHPSATPALIFGILGLVLGLSCGIGGLFGIGGVVAGRRARREIDADPQRYTGRSMASAGFGLGIAGLAVMVGYILLFVILGVTGNLD